MQRRIQQRDGVDQRKPARQVCNGPNRGRDGKTTPDRRLRRGDAAAAHDHANEPRRAVCTGHGGLYRLTGWDIETVKPGSGASREDRRVRQTELGRDQPRHWRLGDVTPDVDATTKSPPACPEQLLTRQTLRARLFESERTFGQLRRNTRSRRHAKNAGRCAAYEQRRPLTPSVRSVGYQGAAIANVAHTRRLSWSGRRASNPLPRPWQGRALPSELLPLGQLEILPEPSRSGTATRRTRSRDPRRSPSAAARRTTAGAAGPPLRRTRTRT